MIFWSRPASGRNQIATIRVSPRRSLELKQKEGNATSSAGTLATAIAHAADAMCPYSKATRGNIDVALNVLTA